MTRDVRKAVAARDAATSRVRRATVGLVATGVGLTAAFSALAASSTHFAKATRVVHRTARRVSVQKHKATAVVAPAPPLVGDQSTAPAPPPTSAPAQAPAAASAPPVVVSGGS